MLAAGATGFFIAGPIGAVVARTQVGLAWDTGAHILSDGETKSGVYQIVANPSDPWNYVDAVGSILSDGVGCSFPGKMAENEVKNPTNSTSTRKCFDDIEEEIIQTKMDYRNSDTCSKLVLCELTF